MFLFELMFFYVIKQYEFQNHKLQLQLFKLQDIFEQFKQYDLLDSFLSLDLIKYIKVIYFLFIMNTIFTFLMFDSIKDKSIICLK